MNLVDLGGSLVDSGKDLHTVKDLEVDGLRFCEIFKTYLTF